MELLEQKFFRSVEHGLHLGHAPKNVTARQSLRPAEHRDLPHLLRVKAIRSRRRLITLQPLYYYRLLNKRRFLLEKYR
jgi:hypothetical protein